PKPNILNVSKLINATNVKTNPNNCKLLITEGDSSRGLILAGLGAVVDKDDWGFYPLGGKFLNVRNASKKQISENKAIREFEEIIGLERNKVYDSTNGLHYGKLIIMTDRVEEMKEFFKNYHKYVKSVKPLDEEDRDLLEMFFGKHKGVTLTSWIKNFKDDGVNYNQSEISIKDIINKELSFFVQNNNLRCIPSLVDGLKLSQFKTLYGCIERDTNESILESYVGNLTGYFHNETSLHSTIIGLAQRFVGSNNISLLEPIGQFGTRYDGVIKHIDKDKYKSYGVITKINPTHLVISELPIGKWTNDYIVMLNKFEENDIIESIVRNNCTDEKIDIEIKLTPKQMEDAEIKGLDKVFQLTTILTTSNMMCFDPDNKLNKYNTPEEILNEFYQIRLRFYVRRRSHRIKELQQQINKMQNIIRFFQEGIDFKGLNHTEIIEVLKSHKFDELSEKNNINNYDYLMNVTHWNYCSENLSKFENDKKSLDNQLIKFHQKSATDIWIEDLDALESELDSLLNNNIENEENTPSTNTKRKLSVYLKDNNQTNIMEEN
ncbi:6541_t:CDS:2, partial [Entrophospora sp. SA101]